MNTNAHQMTAGVEGRPLAGLKVLDFGRFIAAPLCAAMLADHGAEVIRIEPPEGASDREVMPVGIPGRGGLYMQMNRNKKSVTLDFSRPEGRDILERLVAGSDVVVVNLPDGPLRKIGLDFETLKSIRKDIILTTISAFAASGPDRDRVGFDGSGQALSGAMFLTGTGEQPLRAAASYVDYATAMSAAYGTSMALLERNCTGQAQHVRRSLMGTALMMMNPMLMEEATGSRSRSAIGNRSPIAGPSDLFRTRDGWVMVQVIGDAMFRRWTRLLDRPDLLQDPAYASDIARGENGSALSAIMSDWCAPRTTDECLAELEAARLPGCPVLGPGKALLAPSNEPYITTIAMNDGSAGLPLVTGTEPGMGPPSSPAPELGQDTQEVLSELGLKQAELDALRDEGVI